MKVNILDNDLEQLELNALPLQKDISPTECKQPKILKVQKTKLKPLTDRSGIFLPNQG